LCKLEASYIQGGVEKPHSVVYVLGGTSYVVDVAKAEGGHSGSDPLLLRDVFGGSDGDDSFKRAAYIRDGGNAVLVGVAANRFIETGMLVKVQDLVK
jgi:hypothetical protein